MKNFGTLFGYEMKKIWMRPMTWVTVLLFCMVFVYITVQPFFAAGGTTFTTVDTDGNEISRYLTGGERYRLRVEGARALSGQPMDEAFFRTARDTIPLDKTWFDKESYFYLIDPSYCDFYVEFSEWLNDTAEHYYTHHQNGKELSWQRLSEEDAAYWRDMEARVEKPYVYQPVLGPRMLMNMLCSSGLGMFLPLLVGLCVCGLYAQERRARTCALIFSSPQGRRCLYLAKTLAGAGCIDGCFGRWLDQPAVLWPLGMGRSHPAVAVAVGEQPAHHYGAGDFDPAGAFAGVRPGVRGGDGSGVRRERKQCGRTGGFGGRDASGYGHGQKRTGLEGISARQSGG